MLSLLLGNNLANYFVTSLVTLLIFENAQNHRWAEIYATLILTPVLFIFAEIIPKNLYYYKANTLMPSLVWVNWVFYRTFTFSGAIATLKGISRGLSFLFRLDIDTAKAVDVTQRHQVHQIIHETREEGLLSESQQNMMSRLIDIPGVSVASVMIKLNQIERVSVDSNNAVLLKHLKDHGHTRQLVYENERENIIGFIPIYEVLGKNRSFKDLREMTVDLVEIDRKLSVIEAIGKLRDQHAKIAIVVEQTRKYKKTVGIVTIADLVEELTGELTSQQD